MAEVVNKHKMLSFANARLSLDYATKTWFVIALLGQWSFAIYVFIQYAVPFLTGIDPVDAGMRQAPASATVVFFMHIIPTIYLASMGILQLVPSIRSKYRGFHRWNGRIFLTLGVLGAATGLYLKFVAGMAFSQGIALNGLLIIVMAVLSWYFARNRRFDLHQRFAVHTFFLVNGVWSFRLYLMAWLMLNQGPNGNTPNVDGPMDIFISYACYLVPMLVAELYFWAKKQKATLRAWSSAVVMALGALITFLGVIAALLMLWTPQIYKVLTLM